MSMVYTVLEQEKERTDSVLGQKPLHQQNIQKATWQHKKRHQKFDYTAIAGRLEQSVYLIPTFP